MDPLQEQSLKQKKIAFAQSEHVEAVLALMRECGGVSKLVGDTEFETVVNAATLDAQSNMVTRFINQIDSIKRGGLNQVS